MQQESNSEPVSDTSTRGIRTRVDNVTLLTPEYAMVKPPAPKSVKIELTGRCNFACSFCARSQRLRDVGQMEWKLFERLAREMREAGVEELGVFYLGESFMNPWLHEAIAYAKKGVGYPYVFLTTNGSLSTPDKLRKCFEAGLDSLKFSINYSDSRQFHEIARVKPSIYDTVLENIKQAKAARDLVYQMTGHKCGLYGSYIMYDGEQGKRMQKVVDELRPYLDDIYALPLYNQAALVENKGMEVTAGNRGRFEAMRDPLPCWSIFTEGHVSWDGKLSACCFDHDGRFHMGDLTTTPFMEAWHSTAFQELRAAHLKKDVCGTVCEKCVAYG